MDDEAGALGCILEVPGRLHLDRFGGPESALRSDGVVIKSGSSGVDEKETKKIFVKPTRRDWLDSLKMGQFNCFRLTTEGSELVRGHCTINPGNTEYL